MLRTLSTLCFVGVLAATQVANAQRVRTVPVNIESTPPGATVFVDDATGTALGITPLRHARVPRGRHQLLFRLERHAPATLQVNVRRRRETFRIELAALAVIDLRSTDDTTTGATVTIDGEDVGGLPLQREFTPGRHMVQVRREGFVTFSQWVDVAGAQVLTLPITLTRERPHTGSLLVSADVNGAAISVDGEDRGTTPALVEDVTAGRHQVRVSADGFDAYEETVLVEADRRTTVAARLRPDVPTTGSLVVASNVRGAAITLDGAASGRTPATLADVPVGEHIIELSAAGHEPATRTVTVEPGTQRAVQIEMTATPQRPGQIVVRADADAATVLVDGEERGSTPLVLQNEGAGTHAIVVRAEGFRDYRTTCAVAPGEDCEIDATLTPRSVDVRLTVNAPDAHFFIDGEEYGPLPYEGEIAAGSHTIHVTAPNHRDHDETMILALQDDRRLLHIDLLPDGPTPEERADMLAEHRRTLRGTVTHTGTPLPDDQTTLDASIGWPYAFEGRLGIGILPHLDAGVAVRTFIRMTEFEARIRFGFRPMRQLSFGLQGRVMGGIGTRRSNTAGFSVEGLSSIHFGDNAATTIVTALDFSSDRYPYAETDHELRLPSNDRQNLWRFRIGIIGDVVLTANWNVVGEFHLIAAESDPGRRLFGDVLGGGRDDRGFYGRLGVTYKFD